MSIFPNPMWHFLSSDSGHMRPYRGLSLGWLVFSLVAIVVVLGAADTAEATYCAGAAPGECVLECEWCSVPPNTIKDCRYCLNSMGTECARDCPPDGVKNCRATC